MRGVRRVLGVARRLWRGQGTRAACLGALALALGCLAPAARAQLASSFYNVTGIQTRVLPNAVQITIRTDGSVAFGGDQADFMYPDASRWEPRPVTSFRLRLLRARARLPAFVDIGSYPVDSAAVSLGTTEFARPYFKGGDYDQPEPRVDIELRFYVPVQVQRFIVDRRSNDSSGHTTQRALIFNDLLSPRDVEVRIGDDRRSIVITVISDRADAGRAARIRRSDPQAQNHRLTVTSLGKDAFRVDALHAPLADLLDQFSAASGLPLVARADAQKVDVSLLLPSVNSAGFYDALRVGYGLIIEPRSPGEGGGYSVGRNGPAAVTERLPLKYLKPESARLLFPDFLLSALRADNQNNALVVSGSPELVERLRRDVAKLDQPRPQVRVEASVWEFATTEDANTALRLSGAVPQVGGSLDTATGQVSVVANTDQRSSFAAAVDALVAKRRARLVAQPYVLVASGEQGTLFFGQQRYITVLREQWWGQDVQAMKLQIGYNLTVLPLVGAGDDITLDLHPKVSTVDAVEQGTGLPTLGIRETITTTRVRSGDTVLIGGLDSDLDQAGRSRIPFAGPLLQSRRAETSHTAMVVLLEARKEPAALAARPAAATDAQIMTR